MAQSPKWTKCENDKHILNEMMLQIIESTGDLEKSEPQMGFEHFGKVFENLNNFLNVIWSLANLCDFLVQNDGF